MISIVIPVFRNAATLRALAARLAAALGARDYELLLILDAPPDDSAQVAVGLAAADPRIKAIALPRNVGQHRAILAGLARAAGEIAVIMDADLQDSPEAVPALLEYLRLHGDADAVLGARANRFAGGWCRVTSRLFKGALRVLSGFRIPRNAGLFLALRRPLYQSLPAFSNHNVHLLSLLALAATDLPAIPVTRQPSAVSGYTGALRLRTAGNALRTLAGMPARDPQAPAQALPSEARALLEPGRQIIALAAVAVGVFLFRLFLSLCSGWNAEAWMLQVLNRTGHGGVLYRDVFFGSTPLPVYVGRAACLVGGYSAVTLKALCALVDTGVFVATHRFLKALDRPVAPWRLGLFMLLAPMPFLASLYSSLATFFFMGTALAFLRWRRRATLAAAVGSGIGAGLCAACKQNYGVYLLAAAGLSMVLCAGVPLGRRLAHVALAGVMAPLLVFGTLLPTLCAGAWDAMIDFTIRDKGRYVALAGVSFFDGFGRLAKPEGLTRFEPLAYYGAQLIAPLALLAAAALAWALTRAGRQRLLPALPFLLALAAVVYPRADADHISQAGPAIFGALVLAAPAFPAFLRRAAAALGTLLVAALFATLMVMGVHMLLSPEWVFTRLPHLRGLPLHAAEARRLTELAAAVRRQRQPVFILPAESSAIYLVSGVANPTPYDYVLVNAFAPGVQERLIEDIRAGRIQTVLRTAVRDPLVPATLDQAVATECPLVEIAQGYEIRRSPDSK